MASKLKLPVTEKMGRNGKPKLSGGCGEMRVGVSWRRFKLLMILLQIAAFVWLFRDRMFVTVDSGEVLVVYYRLFGGQS